MNQPTREEFEALKEELRQLKEQQTEPIHLTIERRQTEVERLRRHTAMLKELDRKSEELDWKSDIHTAAFQRVETILGTHTETISALQADVASIKATQSDHGEYLKSHGGMLRAILAKLDKE